MDTLKARLDEIRAAGKAKRDPEWTRIMEESTAELEQSGIESGIPSVGTMAPGFARPDLSGSSVRLSAHLREGPVIVSFFRGRW